jgi:putative transposase
LDFHHKTAYALVRCFDTIYVENLNIRGMLRNHHLARVIADAGWGQFFLVLKHKAERAAKTVVEVCPKNTSQNCFGCGEYVPKALSCRTHTCPYCGLILHRDKNAAENIRKKGRDAAFGERAFVNALVEPRTRSPQRLRGGAVTSCAKRMYRPFR